MSFTDPAMLYALLALPAMIFAYLYALRKSSPSRARYPGLNLVHAPTKRRWRRHLPLALLGLALAIMGVALGRPTAVMTMASKFDTVMLAIDVSGSMRATDIQPNRLAAAQAAARSFVARQPADARIGLVAFGEKAAVLQQPTHDRGEITAAIDRLYLKTGTAVGAGIIVALAALFPGHEITLENPRGSGLDEWPAGRKTISAPVSPGALTSAAIILLTDGESTSGPDVIAAAQAAAARGVRIFAVGIGTAEGEVISFDGWRSRVHLEEEVLRGIAFATGGEYFQAQSAGELTKVYETLSARSVVEEKDFEFTAIFAAVAAILATCAAGLSLLWFRRIF